MAIIRYSRPVQSPPSLATRQEALGAGTVQNKGSEPVERPASAAGERAARAAADLPFGQRLDAVVECQHNLMVLFLHDEGFEVRLTPRQLKEAEEQARAIMHLVLGSEEP